MYDVVVVGGGPAGSKTAAELAADRDVLVLEEHREVGRPVQCAGLITENTISISGVRPDILNRFRGADFIFPNGNSVTLRSEDGYKAVMVDRADLDSRLADAALAKGAEYRFSTRYLGHTVRDGRVIIETTGGTVESRIIVGADGHSSKVSDSVPDNRPKEYLRGLEYDLRHTMDVQDMVRIRIGRDIAPGLFTWEAPFGELTRVGLCASSDSPPPSEFIKVLLKRAGLEDSERKASYSGKVPIGSKRRTYGENMLLIGDAAAQVKPVSGGGLYPAMMCVGPLCQTVAEAFDRDDMSERVMSGYHRRWYPLVGKEIDRAYRFRRMYTGYSNEDMDSLYPYVMKKQVREELVSVDIDRPSLIAPRVLRNIPLTVKAASLAMKGRRRG